MCTPTPDAISRMIGDYLSLAGSIKRAKDHQDAIKLALQAHMIEAEVQQLTTNEGTVKRITVAKTVTFSGFQVYDLAKVWHVSKDAIFKQCGELLMNLANFRPERHYLRISAPK